MTERPKRSDIPSMSFEAALEELEEIVTGLERGGVRLEDSIEAYERGSLLQKHCQARLDEARARIDRIRVDGDGGVTAEPLDGE